MDQMIQVTVISLFKCQTVACSVTIFGLEGDMQGLQIPECSALAADDCTFFMLFFLRLRCD